MVKLWFAKVRPDGIIPSKRDEDAGYDIFLAFDGGVYTPRAPRDQAAAHRHSQRL